MKTKKPEPEKLLPCPFCGSIPEIWQIKSTLQWRIICRNADCQIRPSIDSYDRDIGLKHWNKRAPT